MVNKKSLVGLLVLALVFQISFVFAGVGIKWDKESVLVNENEETCLIYYVYNPWPDATNVKIELSDDSGELNDFLTSQESEVKLVPANTPSVNAIPIEFCFTVPEVYDKDCLVGDFLCGLTCEANQKEFSGEVVVKSVPEETDVGAAGGSATTMAVSAPLTIKVRCNPYVRSYTFVYEIVAVIALLGLLVTLYVKYSRPKLERDEEALRKLKAKVEKEKKRK